MQSRGGATGGGMHNGGSLEGYVCYGGRLQFTSVGPDGPPPYVLCDPRSGVVCVARGNACPPLDGGTDAAKDVEVADAPPPDARRDAAVPDAPALDSGRDATAPDAH